MTWHRTPLDVSNNTPARFSFSHCQKLIGPPCSSRTCPALNQLKLCSIGAPVASIATATSPGPALVPEQSTPGLLFVFLVCTFEHRPYLAAQGADRKKLGYLKTRFAFKAGGPGHRNLRLLYRSLSRR
jgi:hypothetical protein